VWRIPLEIIMLKSGATVALIAAAAMATASAASAKEYYIGEPVVKNGVQIVPNYLLGIQMATMVPEMDMAKDAIHLEADVHAAKGNAQKLAEDTWIPYLNIKYTITRPGDPKFKKTGHLQPMIAGDGLHYANGVKMPGPGKYHLTYTISAPAIYRHADKETGVPEWWKPFSVDWDFTYPSKAK
jgi:uncharacterized protein involved in high-affinity Fe2+ transport